MRNNIISLEKYFSIFAYLSDSVVRLQQLNPKIEIFPNCSQTADRNTSQK